MVSKEELQGTFATLPTEKLMEIIDNKFGYTELAVSIAFEELASRKISVEEIKNYKSKQIEKLNNYIKKNISDSLTLSQKNLFYFIWFPLFTFPFKQNYRLEGCALKVKQANYYSLLGLLFFILAAFLSYRFSNLFAAAVWIGRFMPAYLMDEAFNKQKQIKKLQRIFGENDPAESGQEQDA